MNSPRAFLTLSGRTLRISLLLREPTGDVVECDDLEYQVLLPTVTIRYPSGENAAPLTGPESPSRFESTTTFGAQQSGLADEIVEN